MLTLQMLPAGNGDCLWLEYGPPGASRIVIIDGGVRDTAPALQRRIEAACKERGTSTLDVELLVVTHIENDHINGILELLQAKPPIRVKDLWFNGRPQLIELPSLDDDDAQPSPGDLLGHQEGDALSALIEEQTLPWNAHRCWQKGAVMVPKSGPLPVAELDGGLKLTLLGPTLPRLHKLCAAWPDVLGGIDEPAGDDESLPADLLGRRDQWPPQWDDKPQRDGSKANGSSIMLLAEYREQAVLLAADGHAPDLADSLVRLCAERQLASIPLAAFKLPHHGSAKNLSRAVIEKVDCAQYIISTDGTGHRHPDHQAILSVLKYSSQPPRLLFNYEADTTRPWRDLQDEVVSDDFPMYETVYPDLDQAADGLVLTFPERDH